MTQSEYQKWLRTLTTDQRTAVETATKVLTDMLLSLSQQMDMLRENDKINLEMLTYHEGELQRLQHAIKDLERRISAVELQFGIVRAVGA